MIQQPTKEQQPKLTRREIGIAKYIESLRVGGKTGGQKSRQIARRYGLTEEDKEIGRQEFFNSKGY